MNNRFENFTRLECNTMLEIFSNCLNEFKNAEQLSLLDDMSIFILSGLVNELYDYKVIEGITD